jgi:hypothetical protein
LQTVHHRISDPGPLGGKKKRKEKETVHL